MPNLLSLLALLACPVGMGLMMWFMMRDNKQTTGNHVNARENVRMQAGDVQPGKSGANPTAEIVNVATPAEAANPPKGLTLVGLCLNPKVIAGLAAAGLGIWVLAPEFFGAALPLLLIAACPLSMLFMMRGMHGGQDGQDGQGASQPDGQSQRVGQRVRSGLNREERVVHLESELYGLQARQEAIVHEIAQLEAAPPTPLPPPTAPTAPTIPGETQATRAIDATIATTSG